MTLVAVSPSGDRRLYQTPTGAAMTDANDVVLIAFDDLQVAFTHGWWVSPPKEPQ